MPNQGVFAGPLKRPNAAGRTRDQKGKIGLRNSLPRPRPICLKSYQMGSRDIQQSLKEPRNEAVSNQSQRAQYADLANALQREQQPVLNLSQLFILRPRKQALDRLLQ